MSKELNLCRCGNRPDYTVQTNGLVRISCMLGKCDEIVCGRSEVARQAWNAINPTGELPTKPSNQVPMQRAYVAQEPRVFPYVIEIGPNVLTSSCCRAEVLKPWQQPTCTQCGVCITAHWDPRLAQESRSCIYPPAPDDEVPTQPTGGSNGVK